MQCKYQSQPASLFGNVNEAPKGKKAQGRIFVEFLKLRKSPKKKKKKKKKGRRRVAAPLARPTNFIRENTTP
jgi:hypothetical protein